jgi:hypothetical protein
MEIISVFKFEEEIKRVLHKRRAVLNLTEKIYYTPYIRIILEIPLMETLGLEVVLRIKT